MASTRLRPRPDRSAAASARAGQAPAAPQPAPAALAPAPGWGVYILSCADGTLYTGCTSDLTRRLRAHAGRRVKYTRGRLPVALVYWEDAAGKSAALRREAALKRLSRRTKLALCGCAKLC